MNKFVLGAAALAAMAAPAFAADMQPRPYTKAPAYTAPQVVYNWTGFYVGGHVGGAFAGNNSLQGSDARFLGGVQGGFDYQFAPNWVWAPKPSIAGCPTPIIMACCFRAAPS
jgi:outer membrane immunogenic protein